MLCSWKYNMFWRSSGLVSGATRSDLRACTSLSKISWGSMPPYPPTITCFACFQATSLYTPHVRHCQRITVTHTFMGNCCYKLFSSKFEFYLNHSYYYDYVILFSVLSHRHSSIYSVVCLQNIHKQVWLQIYFIPHLNEMVSDIFFF